MKSVGVLQLTSVRLGFHPEELNKKTPKKSLFGMPKPPQPAKYEHEVSAEERGQEEHRGKRSHLLSHPQSSWM